MKFGIILSVLLFCTALTAETTTFLFYINGDNSLESDAIALVNHLEEAQQSDSITIIAQIDRTPDYDATNSDWVNTRRYLVTQDTDTNAIGSQFLEDIGETNMADPDELETFLNWAETNYSADNYHLVIWDYMHAWQRNNTSAHRTALYDRTNNCYMTVPGIAEAIEGSGLDISLLILDMEYKGTVETVFELKDASDYSVVSQFGLGTKRFGYVDLVEYIAQNNSTGTEDAGQMIINQTGTENTASEHCVSLINNNKVENMKNLINDFVNAFDENQEWDVVNSSISIAQTGHLKNYMDFAVFVEGLDNSFGSVEVNTKVTDIIDFTDSLIVANSFNGTETTGKGLSIFVYDYYINDWLKYKYPYCNFAARSYWKSFLVSRLANTSFKSFNCGFEDEMNSSWEIKNSNDDDFFWELGAVNGDSHNGDRCAVLDATSGNEDHDDWLVLPKIYVEPGTRIQFWARSATNSLSDIIVRASHDDDINSDDPLVLIMSDIPTQWSRYVIDNTNLVQYEGSTIKIGIHCDDSQGDALLVDDVDVAYTNDESIIISENFEHGEFPPAGWTLSITNATHTWEVGQNENHPFSDIFPNSHRSIVCNWDGENAQDEWLITNSFNLDDVPATLMFWAGHSSAYLANATLRVHVSADNGVNWNQVYELVDDGLSWSWHYVNIDLSDYKNNSDVKLAFQYVGMDGDLVVIDNVVVFTETTDIDDETNSYKNIVTLKQNTPNPFNPSTSISYNLPQKADVSLNIYNIKGQLVKKLVKEVQEQGDHSVVWHGKDSSGDDCGSGVYFYRLISGENSVIKKMVLLK